MTDDTARTATTTWRVYLIGSLRNPKIVELANKLREQGFEVFDDWFAPGPEADDMWKWYERARGRSYKEALKGYAARHIYEFDKFYIDTADIGVLLLPAGRSGHLELGYMIGQGKPGYILFNEDHDGERWDIMYQFADDVFFTEGELIDTLTANYSQPKNRGPMHATREAWRGFSWS